MQNKVFIFALAVLFSSLPLVSQATPGGGVSTGGTIGGQSSGAGQSAPALGSLSKESGTLGKNPSANEGKASSSTTTLDGIDLSIGKDPSLRENQEKTDKDSDTEKQLQDAQRRMPSDLTPIESMFWAALPPDSGAIRQYGYSFFAAPAPVITAAVGDDYIIGPGDIIVAYLWGDPVDIAEIKNVYELVVDRDGTLFFPPIGRITVWGQSITTVRDVFKSTLAKKYKKLETSLTLGRLREFPVYVSGFVGKPGTVVATAVDSLFDVVARAGGILSTGSLRTIVVNRKDGTSFPIDLYDILVRGKNVDVRMREGDSVLVREIGPVVGIAGQVRRPAVYELRGEKKVGELLGLAGGALPSAFTAGSFLVRFQDQQRRMAAGDISTTQFLDSLLADGDLLYVSRVKDFVENAVSVEGQVKFPGPYPLENGRSLKSVLAKAQVLTDTNLRYARLYRTVMGGLVENVTFEPGAILAGKRDIDLEPLDRVVFYRYGEVGAATELQDFRSTVIVQGEVRYPGMYHRVEGTKLSSILKAEQILPETNIFYGQIMGYTREGLKRRQTFIPKAVLDGTADFDLEPLDTIVFHKIGYEPKTPVFDEFPDTLVLEGPVRYPGLFGYAPGMKLSDLIRDEQFLLNTNMRYAEVLRRPNQGRSAELIYSFSPEDVLSGKADLELFPMDTLRFFPRTLYRPVSISGEVKLPSVISFHPGLELFELLQTVEVRGDPKLLKARIYTTTEKDTFHYLSDLLGSSGYPTIMLEEGDRVILEKLEENEHRPMISIKGEVVSPRATLWKTGMRLSDLIRDSGGFTKDAYPNAIIVVRKSAAELQKARLDDMGRQLDLAIRQTESRAALAAASDQAAIMALRTELEAQKAQLISLKEARVASALGRISIDLPNTLEALSGSPDDIVLERDDTVFVPATPSYILIVGAVSNQVILAYRSQLRVRDALGQAGWATSQARLNEAYIIKANGKIESSVRSGFLLFKPSFMNALLGPGDTLVVPSRTEAAYNAFPVIKDIIQILTQVVGTTVSTLALIQSYNK